MALIRVTARHERDTIDHVLGPEQITELEHEIKITMETMFLAGIYTFIRMDGWVYRLQQII